MIMIFRRWSDKILQRFLNKYFPINFIVISYKKKKVRLREDLYFKRKLKTTQIFIAKCVLKSFCFALCLNEIPSHTIS